MTDIQDQAIRDGVREAFDIARTIECSSCKGSGVQPEDHGQGQVESLSCPDCEGTGRVPEETRAFTPRELAREELAQEIDGALDAQRELYEAAAAWMALMEFVMQSDHPVRISIVESPQDGQQDERAVRVEFPDHINEIDVRKLFADFSDDLMIASTARKAEIARSKGRLAHEFVRSFRKVVEHTK